MRHAVTRWSICVLYCGACFSAGSAFADDPLVLRKESFSTDPQWHGYRNRLLPESLPTVKQDFGYRTTQMAGGAAPGEIGGIVHRSTTPASYFRTIPTLTLEDAFSASGRLSVRHAEGGSGVMLGWFHESSRGWRTPNSVALRIDGNGGNFWVFYEYGTRSGRTGGAGAFEGDRYQTTKTRPYPGDGTSHRWSLTYDPRAANGLGSLTLAIDDQQFPPVTLSEEDRRDGATFDRFGLWNVQIAGSPLEIYLDDLVLNGETFSFDQDPGWEGRGHHVEFTDRILRPFHDFGYRNRDGGKLEGIIFRDEKPAYYAAQVGRLTLDDPLHASGTIVMHGAAADSGFCLGWFNSAAKRNQLVPEYEQSPSDLLAAMIEGPSRVGHYFRATYRTSQRQGIIDGDGVAGTGPLPIIRSDGKVHTWELHYDPAGANGRGTIDVVFDNERRRIPLRPGDRQAGAVFDSFGVFNIQAGGHHVDFSIDDLSFTAR